MSASPFVILRARASDELTGDLKDRSRQYADRKVARFLDSAATAPFVAAMDVFAAAGAPNPERTAIFTISEWEPEVPHPPFEIDDSEETRVRLAAHYQDKGNPNDCLRAMPNNALCQASIIAGFRGPNAHYIGDATCLDVVLATAERTLVDGFADAAVVVAYDAEGQNPPPDLAHTRACAVLIGQAADGGEVALVGDWSQGTTAREALDDVIAAARAVDQELGVTMRIGSPYALSTRDP